MSLQTFFDSFDNECTPMGDQYVTFEWSMKGHGFGQLGFYVEDGKLYCDNECMSKERVKAILCAMVDNAIFDRVTPFDE